MAERSPVSEPAAPLPSGAASSRLPHILVVDDQQVVREFLADVLRLQGYRVSLAASGPEALEIARQDAPHVCLTDLAMKGMDGQDLITRLREEHPAVVPVVITGFGTVQRTVELMRRGAFDVLTKPCPAGEIAATIAKALEHHDALQVNHDLRERLKVQEKLAMIGKLAAGVAHELNNPLDAALRCVRMAKERAKGDAEASEVLDLAQAGLTRMADIVKSLLTFSRHAAVEQAPLALARLVDETVMSVSLALGDEAPKVVLAIEPDAADLPVPRGLNQVLTNLLRNAADATGRTGRVRVEGTRDAEHLRLRVVDDGPGMPPAVLQRIFEPFYTTKAPGKGTGLGLPISARIVEKFGGAVTVECPAAGGTVVTVTLPVGAATPKAA
jgi:signal transduction histidine kinase